MEISKKTKERLDLLVPGWESLLDKDSLIFSEISEVTEETNFLRNLIIKKREKIYEANARETESVLKRTKGKTEEEAAQEFQKLKEFSYGNIEQLTDFEEKILEIICTKLTELESIIEVDKNLNQTVILSKEDIRERTEIHNRSLDVVFDSLLDKFPNLSRDFLNDQLTKIKKEDEKSLHSKIKYIEENLNELIKEKINNRPGNLDHINLKEISWTPQEKEKITEDYGNIIRVSLTNQKEVRTQTIEEIVKNLTGISNISEIIDFIEKFREQIPCKYIDAIKQLIKTGCIINSLPKIRKNKFKTKKGWTTKTKVTISVSSVVSLLEELKVITREKEDQQHEIFNYSVYKFCNKGWWAPLTHIATLGFCSGTTVGANIIAAIDGDKLDWKSLGTVADTLLFFINLPLANSNLINNVLSNLLAEIEDVVKEKIIDTILETIPGC